VRRPSAFPLVLGVATVVTLAFLALPIVAIFLHTSPKELLDQLSNPVVKDALWVTLKTSVIAQLLIVGLGTPTAYLLAGSRFRGRSLAIVLVELPLVLPPAVAGIGLIAALGTTGLLGGTLDTLGLSIAFDQTAVTLAVAYVASPLYVRQAIAAFEATDPNLMAASRTLGAGPARTFFRVVLPLASGGLLAGLALSFARGLGEFGATIMFAGSLQGVTQTFSLAIYAEFARVDGFNVALAMGGVLRAVGIEIPFTQVAVVMALAFVASPFYVRQAHAAFAAVDPELLGAARTLGAGPGGAFWRVGVPVARQGLSAGAALAWARALGEFGATIMFAGSLQGRTQTLPLAIYGEFSGGDLRGALAIAALLVVVSAGLLVGVRAILRTGAAALEPRWTRSSTLASASR